MFNKPITPLYQGANWTVPEDGFTKLFVDQNLSQFWRPEDISLQPDLNVWDSLDPATRLCYVRNLLMLTYLDTYQGDIGMTVIGRSIPEQYHQRKALTNYMAAMENAVHSPSYSTIFITFLTQSEINELFQWGDQNQHLQSIMHTIVSLYKDLDKMNYQRDFGDVDQDDEDFRVTQWKAFVASVNLESSQFYSGFFYPLYFYGMGKLMQAGEIINLILRDESVHGLYISMLAKELFQTFSKEKQAELVKWASTLMKTLYGHQMALVDEIYAEVGLIEEVKKFARYNANKAMLSLGLPTMFDEDEEEEVNTVVLNGLNTETKSQDNFSMKGNGYQKIQVEAIHDEDFYFTIKGDEQ